MTRAAAWSNIAVGSRVIVRRADGTTFETRTASQPFEMMGGVPVVRVVSLDAQDYYALDRVHLAPPIEPAPIDRPLIFLGSLAPDQPAAVTLADAVGPLTVASALDREPEQWTASEMCFGMIGGVIGIYVASLMLGALIDLVAR